MVASLLPQIQSPLMNIDKARTKRLLLVRIPLFLHGQKLLGIKIQNQTLDLVTHNKILEKQNLSLLPNSLARMRLITMMVNVNRDFRDSKVQDLFLVLTTTKEMRVT